jgi:hypothetical protein
MSRKLTSFRQQSSIFEKEISRKIAYFRPKSRVFIQKPSFAQEQEVAKSQ